MRYAFSYPNSTNLGDDVQTLAALQFMGEDVSFVPRDQLGLVTAPGQVLLNGWWSHDPSNCFPPKIDALPISMHLGQTFRDQVKELGWFSGRKAYTRDVDTMLWLQSHGIDAEFGGCLTLTFPEVVCERKMKILFVDTRPVPGSRCLSMITQIDPINNMLPDSIRRAKARRLLDFYTQAELVITSRMHCALPCAAMGVPVIWLATEGDLRLAGTDRFVTICTDGKLNAAIDREEQTRAERTANVRQASDVLRGVISKWLLPNKESTSA